MGRRKDLVPSLPLVSSSPMALVVDGHVHRRTRDKRPSGRMWFVSSSSAKRGVVNFVDGMFRLRTGSRRRRGTSRSRRP